MRAQSDRTACGCRSGRRSRYVGVTEVLSFDDSTVRLTTTRGALTLEGQGMRVTALDTEGGVVSVTGLLFGAFYTEAIPSRMQMPGGAGGGFPACSGDMPHGTDVWKYRRGCWGRCSRCRL